MMNGETNYFHLNIGNRWPTFELTDLEIGPDGALQLRALPRLAGALPETVAPLPPPQAPAGIARTRDGACFFSEPERHRLWRIDPCDPAELPQPAPCLGGKGHEAGQFKFPRGLLYLPGRGLLVADSGNQRLQLIDALTAQVREIWGGYDDRGAPLLDEPWAMTLDGAGNIYVLVAGGRSVRKLDPLGRIDPEFTRNIEAVPGLGEPVAVALAEIEGEERLLVLDRAARAVLIYSQAGHRQKRFEVAELQAPLAMAVSERAIYIGDSGAGPGSVLQFDLPRLSDDRLNLVGAALGYQGPVAALFLDRAGAVLPSWCNTKDQTGQPADEAPTYLLLLPGQGHTPLALRVDAGYRPCGFALAGPFDFRQRPVIWHRLQALAEALPPHTHARFFFRLGETAPGTPRPTFDPCHALAETLDHWCSFPPDILDGMFSSARPATATNDCGGAFDHPAQATYLWLGLMFSGDGTATPRLHQLRVQFDHDSYLPYLPALYTEEQASRKFLLPFLSLFESFFAEQEAAIAGLPARFDPAAAPPDYLAWLTGWLAQDFVEEWSDARQRQMIAEAFAAYAWRGTPAGLRRRLQLFAGVEAHILEPLLETDLWSLGETSTLGVDTRLVAAHPQGAVAGSTATLDQSHLISEEQFGEPLFAEVAHRFAVQVYPGQVNSPEKEAEVRQVIERDKPAHTEYHLCFVQPAMRVGFQARLGIDTVVAGPPAVQHLDEELGRPGLAGRSGQASRIGLNTHIY